MQRFKFRLQTTLEIAQKREDLKKQELAICQNALREALEILNILQKQNSDLEEEFEEEQKKNLRVGTIQIYRDYITYLKKRIQEQNELIIQLTAVVDQCKNELLQLMKDRKVLEKLKHRYWTEYQQEVLHEEQKIIDEIATNQFILKEASEK